MYVMTPKFQTNGLVEVGKNSTTRFYSDRQRNQIK